MRLIFLFFRKMRSRFFSARHLTGLLHARRNYQLGFIALGAGTAVVLNERVKGAVFSIYDVIAKKSIEFFEIFSNFLVVMKLFLGSPNSAYSSETLFF